MPRLVGIDIPENKRIVVALTYIYGVGPATSRNILQKCSIDESRRARELNDGELAALKKEIETNYDVEGDKRREVQGNIKTKMDIGCYQGLRHRKGLPVHGQRTHTNARTRKGKGKTIANKKKAVK